MKVVCALRMLGPPAPLVANQWPWMVLTMAFSRTSVSQATVRKLRFSTTTT
jgi:hypothetical protein